MRKLTKHQVLSLFSDHWHEIIIFSPTSRGDSVAKRQAFNDYVDSLNKDGLVSDAQAFRWSNPF